MSVSTWREIADGVLVRRYMFLDQTIGVVIGRRAALVIDTRSTDAQARELLADLRSVTNLPHVVVNTHWHFDHTYGNATFRPCEIWGHPVCAAAIREHGEVRRERVAESLPDLATEIRAVRLDPPDHLVALRATIELGGREAELRHLGRGHTDNDLVVLAPDAGVCFAGDLVEQGNPPAFGDAYPLDWPATLGQLLDAADGPVVPGHGEPVDRDFVASQLADIGFLAETARRSWPDLRAGRAAGDGRAPDDLVEGAARHLGWPAEPVRTALERAFHQIATDAGARSG